MIAIIDYGAGNLKSVEKALEALGEKPVISQDPEVLIKADGLILPGVGAFGDAMERLNASGMADLIRKAVQNGIPLLGICLGLQLLFEESEESPGAAGLGLLKGKIVKIPGDAGLKVPHMGWNSLHLEKQTRLFAGIPEESYFYFVHSYYLKAEDRSIVAATTQYGVTIDAAIETGRVFACQFHPEKSSSYGMRILQNFINAAGT